MPSSKLPNYLRSHRKHARLSQGEVAFLLGSTSEAGICRHERFQQTPNLKSLLAYEMLFRTPIREMFSGVHHEVKRNIRKRTKLLIKKLVHSGQSHGIKGKLETLQVILKGLSCGHA